jgi:CheY-like chemotaxis protein
MKLKEIMLVDDNDIDNYITKVIIEKENIAESIVVKSSSLEALDYLKNSKTEFPELILLDIKMPVMDGFGFLNEFSKFTDSKKFNCAIVMLSSSISTADIEGAKNNQHVIEYLSKPINKTKIDSVLNLIHHKKTNYDS